LEKSERMVCNSQGAEEMMKVQQQKQGDGDVVRKEVGDGDDQDGGEVAGGGGGKC
jgi:hypothetical protein